MVPTVYWVDWRHLPQYENSNIYFSTQTMSLVLKNWNCRSDKKFAKSSQWFLMCSQYVNKRMKPWFWAWISWKIFIDWLLEIELISPSQTSFMFTFRFQWNPVGVDKKQRSISRRPNIFQLSAQEGAAFFWLLSADNLQAEMQPGLHRGCGLGNKWFPSAGPAWSSSLLLGFKS